MRLFFATDLHGSDTCFRKFLAARTFYEVDYLVLGGDLTGKALVPIVRTERVHSATFEGHRQILRSEEEVRAFELRARQIGYYTLRVTEEELAELSANPSLRLQHEHRLVRERLDEWARLASLKLPAANPIYVCPGNDDDLFVDDILQAADRFVWTDQCTVGIVQHYTLIGLSGTNHTPWATAREFAEVELAAQLRALDEFVSDWSHTICNIHVPPYDSGLDLCPELSPSLQIRIAPGYLPKKPVGSTAVRDFVHSRQPLLGLFGHVHEAKGKVALGRTICVNPGSTFHEAVLSGAIVEIKGDAVISTQFTTG